MAEKFLQQKENKLEVILFEPKPLTFLPTPLLIYFVKSNADKSSLKLKFE